MNREYVVTPGGSLLLGSGADVDLSVPGVNVSGHHAHIEYPQRGRRFELVDHSTNGTLVQTEDDLVHYVHRDRLAMWGEGWLSLGVPLSADTAVRYTHV